MTDTLGGRGEDALLDAIRRLVPAGRGVLLGPGDDAAVLRAVRHPILLTTDALVEHVHFRREWLSWRALGERAFEVNASDIAAMGGRPIAAVLAVAAPSDLPTDALRGIVQGVRAAARRAGAALAGGNLARARDVSLTVALVGEAPAPPVTRAGGRAGDQLFVTGDVGGAALGLRLLKWPRDVAGGAGAIRRWQRPVARLRAGAAVARRNLATAMIDLSDGLLIDAGRLCRASGVGAVLRGDRLPLARALRGLAPRAALELALAGGEDYELLFAVPVSRLTALDRARSALGCRVSHVGALVPGDGVRVVDRDGRVLRLPRRAGHQHFGAGGGRGT